MKDAKNNPAVTIALIVILIGAVGVTVMRIRGGAASAGNRAVAEEAQSAAQTGPAPALDDIPPARDPFGHPVLFTPPMQGSKQMGAPNGPQLPPSNLLPMPPLKVEGIRPINPLPPGQTSRPAADKPRAQPPSWKLQAVVSGDAPLAIIKDDSGKTHFVHEGDQLGDGVIVARIISGTVAIRYGGTFSILSIERGSGVHEKTE